MIVLEADSLVKTYPNGTDDVTAVRSATVGLERGELVLLMGPSGSGKTTLLSILGCILKPDDGCLRVCGQDVTWDEATLPEYRRRYFGFIYQHFHLLSALNVRDNVRVPLMLAGRDAALAEELADHALGTVGLEHRARFRPSLLSGGEKQRLAVARAIATDAPILLADEPTGNLDTENGRRIMSMLRSLADKRGKTVLIVTHDERHVTYAHRVWKMQDGELYEP